MCNLDSFSFSYIVNMWEKILSKVRETLKDPESECV